MSAQKRKRQSISIEVKKKVLDAAAADSKKSYADLAKEFSDQTLNLTKSNVQSILNSKAKIMEAIDDGASGKRARLTTGRHVKLEEAVLTWFKQVRSENVAISGPLLKVRINFRYEVHQIHF